MTFKSITPNFSVSAQLTPEDVHQAAVQGFKSIICNRPDGEEAGQPSAAAIQKEAEALGLSFTYIPAVSGAITEDDTAKMKAALADMPSPILAYCRSGARSSKLWEMATKGQDKMPSSTKIYDVVIVGGGSAGIATASSLLKRNQKLSIAVIEPSEDHYYQPGWTMVGAGVFSAEFTKRPEKSVMPKTVDWIKKAASGFAPEDNQVLLADGSSVAYRVLVACPGIKLDWEAIDGLTETLGQNGVTSNYRYDLAPYTNRLTEKGLDLLPTMIALRQWGEKWGTGVPSNPVLVDELHHQPILPVTIRSHDDRVLGHMDLCWMNSADIKPISNAVFAEHDDRVRKLSAI
jgi:sulfide:quinone oxidoreductase